MLDDRTMHRYQIDKSHTRQVSQNHRENYQNFTNSDIFFNKNAKVSIDDSETKQRPSSFVPKYSEKSAQERKMIEFYKPNISTNYDTNPLNLSDLNITSQKNPSIIENSNYNSKLNAKERKIKEIYPNMKNEEIVKLSKNEMNPSQEERKTDMPLEPKKAVVSNLYSNIFNDPKKDQTLYVNQMNLQEVKKSDSKKAHVNVPKSKNMTNLQWLSSNSELIFKEKSDSQVEYSPKRMKMKNLCQSNNNNNYEKDLSMNLNFKSEKSELDNSVQKMSEVKKMLQEKFGTNHKYCKAIETIGRFHRDEFYKTLKIDQTDRAVESYISNNIVNYEQFNLNEIKKMFFSNGIHIYDIKLDGKYTDGNNSGKLGFKIRKNNDNEDFEKKKNELFDKMNKMGLILKESNNKNRRPLTCSLPSNINWSNHQVEKYTKNNNNFEKIVMQPKIVPDSEKLSKIFPETNINYKNTIINARTKNVKSVKKI